MWVFLQIKESQLFGGIQSSSGFFIFFIILLVGRFVLTNEFQGVEHVLIVCLEREILCDMVVDIFLRKFMLLFEMESCQLFFCLFVKKIIYILGQLLGLLHSYRIVLEESEFALAHKHLILSFIISNI